VTAAAWSPSADSENLPESLYGFPVRFQLPTKEKFMNLRKQNFEVNGYATAKNAERKIESTFAKYEGEPIRWLMHINEAGRYVPVAINYPNNMLATLVHAGICVV
jgi:hypothetical protein